MGKEKISTPESVQRLVEFLKTLFNSKLIMKLLGESLQSYAEMKYLIHDTSRLVRVFSCSVEDWEKECEVCNDFSYLSNVLTHLDFSDKDISEIVFYLIKKNLVSGKNSSCKLLLSEENFIGFPFQNVSAQDVLQFIVTGAYACACKKKEEELSKEERILISEINQYQKTNLAILHEILSYHQTIQTHYFDKSDCFDFEDISFILDALKNLEVSASVLGSVNKTLRKELRQRNSGIHAFSGDESSTHEEETSAHEEESSNHEESEKEKQERERQKREAFLLAENKKRRDEKAIYKLMSDIYDIDSREFLVIPTDAVILKWVSYAKNVQLPLSTILHFLIDAYRQISTMDPVVQYGILYKKLKYYEEAVGISNELKELEQYLDALLEAGSTYTFLVKEKKQQAIDDSGLQEQGEEISFWEGELQKKLEQTLELVPKDYDYELKH